MNSRAKGRKGEIELARILANHWPEAIRNLDQFGADKRDIVVTDATHWQVKRVEKLNVWNALDQTITEAAPGRLPVLAFRRNFTREPLPSRSSWFAALELNELLEILQLRATPRRP